jgi:hypothetical protein
LVSLLKVGWPSLFQGMTLGTRLERLRTQKIVRTKVKVIYFAIGYLLHVKTVTVLPLQ